MSWSNYHNHTKYSDGRNTPKECVEKALDLGMISLGFSDHAPLPFQVSWAIQNQDLNSYCKMIKNLTSEIPIFLGLEIDFIPGLCGPGDSRFRELGLDYTIGSVHFVGKNSAGKYWDMDTSAEIFTKGLEEIYDGSIRLAVETYYHNIREMVRTQPPDIIGHFDYMKIYNANDRYFSESEDWNQKAVMETLNVISKSNCILEVNTGQFARGQLNMPYPSDWILEQSLKLNIPITLSSDSHRSENLTAGFEQAASILNDIGYREIQLLEKEGWKSHPFDENGIIVK